MQDEAQKGQERPPESDRLLPVELILLISSSLDRLDLSRLSRTTRYFRAITLPILFKHVDLEDSDDPSWERRVPLWDCLKALSLNRDSGKLVQSVSVRLYSTRYYYDKRSIENLAQFLSQTKIRSFRISYEDDDGEESDVEYEVQCAYSNLWKSLLLFPQLQNLSVRNPLAFDLNLTYFPALKRLTLSDSELSDSTGSLPNLTYLTLDNFQRLNAAWLPPRVIRTLQGLRLRKFDLGDTAALTAAFRRFSSIDSASSALRSLVLVNWCIGTSWWFRNMDQLLASVKPSSFPDLITLEVRSLDDQIFDPINFGFRDRFLSHLPSRFPLLRELVIMRSRGYGHSLSPLVFRSEIGDRLSDHLARLSPLRKTLQFLTVNYWDYTTSGFEAAEAAFQILPKLVYFAIRANEMDTDSEGLEGEAWIVDNTDETSRALGVLCSPLKPLLGDSFDDDSIQLDSEFSIRWYRDTVKVLRARRTESEKGSGRENL